MDRSNHYEAAFEAYLQWHRMCYVAVDQTRRSMLGETRVKSLDFIVYGDNGSRLLVDVKGRRFPCGSAHCPRRVWQNWTTRADLDGLARWQERCGPEYVGLLVFNYQVLPTVELPDDTADLWTWRGKRYLLRAVRADEYCRHQRLRSPKWDTVDLPGACFRQLVRPFHQFTHGSSSSVDHSPSLVP